MDTSVNIILDRRQFHHVSSQMCKTHTNVEAKCDKLMMVVSRTWQHLWQVTRTLSSSYRPNHNTFHNIYTTTFRCHL